MKQIHRRTMGVWARILLGATAVLTLWVVAVADASTQDEPSHLVDKPNVQVMIEKIRAAGEPTISAQLEPPDVPDKDNAFLLYKKAAAKITNASEQVDEAASRLAATPVSKWKSKDITEIRAYVKANAEAISLAREGAQLTGYKSDTQWAKGSAMLLPQIAQTRKLARLLCYKARVDLADGHTEEAIKICGDVLRMVGLVSSESNLISRLMEIACRNMAMSIFTQILAHNKNTALATLALQTLSELPPIPRLKNALIAERAWAINVFEEMRAGKTTPEDILGASVAKMKPTPDLIDRAEIDYLEDMQGYINLSDKPYYEIADKLKSLESDVQAKRRPGNTQLGAMLLLALSRVYESDAASRARSDVMRTAAALKTYKLQRLGYPKTLAELVPKVLPNVPVDEFSGQPLKYARLGDGFVVYSVGVDLVDDMGFPGSDKRSGDIAYTEE